MRILHLYKDFYPPVVGGIERALALTCRYHGPHADVRALVCGRRFWSRIVQHGDVEVTELGEWGRFQGAPASATYPLQLWRMPADLIVLHTPNPTAEISVLLAQPKAKLVIRYHSDVVRQAAAMRVYAPIFRQVLRRADLILPTSDRYLATSPYLRAVSNSCRVLPLGIDLDRMQTPDTVAVEAMQQAYGRFVLFAGMHRYYKGLDYLVEAAPSIDAKVVVAGEGPETARLQTKAQELGAGIAFVGRVPDDALSALLHACALVAFPSVARSEAFGLGILEAHACAKPVVATQLGTGVEMVNAHGETGINVPPRDAPALADAINALLADPARCEALGTFARERVHREFDAASIAEQELAIYREVLGCG